MDLTKVEEALVKIEPGLKKYVYIMNRFDNTDVSSDLEFQKRYNGFYRMRQRQPEFYNEYYNFMENHKGKEVSFDQVLNHLYYTFNRIEASFSSKMIAILNPNMPVWDEYILKNLGLTKPSYGSNDRVNKTIGIYNQIINWYVAFMKTQAARNMIALFDKKYENAGITDIKKIDLILWQIR